MPQNYEWTRLRTPKGYVYAKTRNNRPIEFSSTTGRFRVYEQPDEKSHSFETSRADAKETEHNVGIQRTPDNHNAYLEKQRQMDLKIFSHLVFHHR